MTNHTTTTLSKWRSPASEYKRARVKSAAIKTAWYPPGVYHCNRVNGFDYFFATKRLYITILQIDGSTWMVDDPPHWWSMQEHAAAFSGHVVCAGLGLGLMVHALNENSKVEKITVVERSQDVIDLVGPQVPHEKLEIIHADWFDQSKETIPDVDGVLFDLFVGDGRDFIGHGINIACKIYRRWDDPVVRVHGLANPWIGDVAKSIVIDERSPEYQRMIESVRAQGGMIMGLDEI